MPRELVDLSSLSRHIRCAGLAQYETCTKQSGVDYALVSEAQPQIGSTANTYVILAKLATGGMAELFLARNASGAGIERYVVLKRVLGHRANDASFVQMFLDEARLAAQLQHPNIAQVYDTGVIGDSYFFTMEFVHGETVRQILHRGYERELELPLGCVLTIAAHTAAGLHHAHERRGLDGEPLGIVHRDVSPSNLMVTYEGHVKVVDFGVAKATVRSSETESGTVKGKISYMSPEQCRGRVLDRRSDLFALGIVMWEMLAGDRLFKRTTDYENMEAIVKEQAPSLLPRRPALPAAVDAIVQKLLSKDPAARYQTADELVEAIEFAASAANVQLSTASLGRFMRELFGQRREPWLDFTPRDATTEAVTVTAAPLGGGNNLSDAQLASVPELQAWAHGSESSAVAPRVPTRPGSVPSPRAHSAPRAQSAATASRVVPPPRTARRVVGVIALAVGIGAIATASIALIRRSTGGASGRTDARTSVVEQTAASSGSATGRVQGPNGDPPLAHAIPLDAGAPPADAATPLVDAAPSPPPHIHPPHHPVSHPPVGGPKSPQGKHHGSNAPDCDVDPLRCRVE